MHELFSSQGIALQCASVCVHHHVGQSNTMDKHTLILISAI